MNRHLMARFGKFCSLAIALIVVSPVQADNFAGSYNPMVEYDDNISDGVTILQNYSTTLVVSTKDANGDRTVTISDGNDSVVIDTIESESGRRIYNPQRPVAYPGWNLLDFTMVSDGVNKAFAMVGQEDYNPLDIGFIVGSWSDISPVLSPNDFAGSWSINFYGDTNLRDVPEGISPSGVLSATISESGENEIFVSGSSLEGDPYSFVMQVSGNAARLVNPPVTSSAAVCHTLQITSDGSWGSGYMVATELEDESDVSITILLAVPPGDLNGDGNVDNLDITPFIYALTNGEAAFEAQYPDGAYWAADCHGDGNVDNLDITPFIDLLSGGGEAIPEPATLSLLVLGACLVVTGARKYPGVCTGFPARE